MNPNGTAAGSQEWSAIIAGGGYGSTTGTACGPGTPAYALLSTAQAVPVGSSETLHYNPPSGSTLDGGRVDVALFADGRGYNASGTAVAYTPEFQYDASNVFFQCAAGLTPCSGGTNDYSGVLEIPGGRGGGLYLSAACGGEYERGRVCSEGGSEGAWSLVRLYWAQLSLSNGSAPAATGFAGPLLAGNARGVSDLTFTASDPEGPGVYQVLVAADGKTLYDGTPDSNGGACAAVGSSGGALMFDAAQPCKRTESIELALGTSGLSDGAHDLKVTVTDAAQNSSVVYDGTITTENAPLSSTPPSVGETPPRVGEPLSGQSGTWSAPPGSGSIGYAYHWQSCDPTGADCRTIPGASEATYTPGAADTGDTLRLLVSASDSDGASTLASEASAPVSPVPGAAATLDTPPPGAANGQPASPTAQLAVDGPTRVVRSYRDRALTVDGTLKTASGTPIAGATLDVLALSGGRESLLEQVSTMPDGAFTARVAAGPSRRLLVAYRAFSGESAYSAQAAVTETVSAGITLRVSPHTTWAAGTITLSGAVAGPLPRNGVVVELLVHYRGVWAPFRDPHTSAGGRFSVRYHFEGATGRFPFRAQVIGEQSGFPYASGLSRVVDVRSG